MYNLSERQNLSRKFPDEMYGSGPEGIGAVRARTHEEQRGGQSLQSWNPGFIFVLLQ